MNSVGIIALGSMGQALAQSLVQNQTAVLGTYHTSPKGLCSEVPFDFSHDELPNEIQKCETIFWNLPPSAMAHNEKRFEDHLRLLKNHRVFFVSSTSVYPQTGLCDESTPPAPETKNGRFLIRCEQMLQNTVQNSVILRPAGLYGRGRHPGYFLAGRHLHSSGHQRVQLADLDDVIGVILALLHSEKAPKCINLVNIHHPTKQEYYADWCLRNHLQPPVFSNDPIHEPRRIQTRYKDFELRSELP